METIGKFFARLGFPLRAVRQSWGAYSSSGVLLTTWADELDGDGRYVRVLRANAGADSTNRWGVNERIDHLRVLWSGGLPGYAVVATAKDVSVRPRAIKSFDNQNVRAILALVSRPDGSIWARLGDAVPVARLKKHAASHRPVPGEGEFPIGRSPGKAVKRSSAPYVAKLPAIRRWLIEVARNRTAVTYAEARKPFGLRPFEHRHVMDRIGHDCLDAGEPILTSLIVDAKTRRCSPGFANEFYRDDAEEREDCYAFWAPRGAPVGSSAVAAQGASGSPTGGALSEESLRERAARFAMVAVRPDQAAFRRRVFMKHGGACIVTGCEVPEALDAAHREGRDWRLGHNLAADGFLLRKDIHALYDAGLVRIDDDGVATFEPRARVYYQSVVRKR